MTTKDYRATAGEEMAGTDDWSESVGDGPAPTADAAAYGLEPNDFASFLSTDDALQSPPPAA
jgi:hypothetical protein